MAGSSQTTLTIPISLSAWTKSEGSKHRDTLFNEIKKYVCALLNNNGGTLILKALKDESIASNICLRSEDVIRAIEQKFHPVIGTACVSSHLSIQSETPTEIVLKVEEFKFLCTLNYNMFLPTDTQVLPIKSDELSTVIDLMDIDRIVDVTDFEKAQTIDRFVLNSDLGFKESKTVQFKCLKSEKSKYNDLASRIINNKFTSYVSAFANHIGGRIYIGIDKDGRVVGETVSKAKLNDLETKLEKHIDKMLWPESCLPLVKGKQWNIQFHPVIDNDGCPVKPETTGKEVCVIVITIHACPGGVFIKKPESYQIVKVNDEGSDDSHTNEYEVHAMEFEEWKTRLLYPKGGRDIPRTLSRCDWSTSELRKRCDVLDGKLLRLINFAQWKAFEEEAKIHQPKEGDPNEVEVQLVLLSKWYVYHYRRGEEGDFENAHKIMDEFNAKFGKSQDSLIFNVRGRLCFSALQRTQGRHEDSYRTARDILSDVEQLSPCILSAEYYAHFATMLTIIEGNEELSEKLKGDLSKNSFKEEAIVFYNRALEHLRKIHYVPLSKVDMQQKSLINLAILKLGCSLSGDVVDDIVRKEDIEAAKTCLKQVEDLIQGGNPLTGFRSCHNKFATSSLHYRLSQHERQVDKRTFLLQGAIDIAEDVEVLASKRKFHELANYAREHGQVYRKELEQLQTKNGD